MSDEPKKDPIASSLGMVPLDNMIGLNDLDRKGATREQIDDDFDYARQNLYEVIEKGQQALSNLTNLADQSQNARMYEVLSTLMNTLVNANKDLLDLQKKNKELKGGVVNSDQPKSITNNTLVLNGTTTDLQRLISDMKKD